ncbi:DDHD domain-containing protein [Aspergillus pseudoustus]|uniref:DDHD domain-containing protein n=1 Tax=Aspergillus pseudoustus TaxID=1810923 RepID=A0ABR4JTH1_9EURO
MAGPLHTYGPTCLLADDDPDLSTWHSLEKPPKPRPQFFYTSSLPIDDPLSSLPPPPSGQAQVDERIPPQPFSVRDHIALEEAWLAIQRTNRQDASRPNTRDSRTGSTTAGIAVPGREAVVTRESPTGSRQKASLAGSQRGRHIVPGSVSGSRTPPQKLPFRPNEDSPRAGYQEGGSLERTSDQSTFDSSVGDGISFANPLHRKRDISPCGNLKSVRRKISGRKEDPGFDGGESVGSQGRRSRDASISGSPFLRASTAQPPSPLSRSLESVSVRNGDQEPHDDHHAGSYATSKPSGLRTSTYQEQTTDGLETQTDDGSTKEEVDAKIPVGVSRLHLVELPNLKMKPIYWSPLHDISNVLRATWFYKNTMLPVETELANRLEDGYTYLKPWTETWQDELNSCVENGAEAELKIVHRLWPKEDDAQLSRNGSVQDAEGNTSDIVEFVDNRAAGGSPALAAAVKPYMTSSVIYADGKNAQILRPSLLPSASRGRRPLSAIRKGRQIGIPVVRGFSRRAWEKLHPSKPSPVDVRNYLRGAQAKPRTPGSGGQICYACAMEESRPTPTDLIFVIHGIGQKLSERMESFHFTHAINAFRRQVNVELNSEEVWPHVRDGHGGIMVLPINWRSTLSLEDANLESQVTDDPATNHFTLKDITPETIPAVRSLISDVILDIPYYLSHHKPKMIEAVVKEANRVFRLWCGNNPGFQQNGRVHLVAHSLGSAMAVDILSHQPTTIPDFDFPNVDLHTDIFEFDTKNLFICGSPVGLFLFINKGAVLNKLGMRPNTNILVANISPRKGRDKPGAEGDDRLQGVASDVDTYGCLAVDNLYNIMHTTDPIAYRVNAAVDSDLAGSLKPAAIPSTSGSIWKSLSSPFRWSSSAANSLTPERPSLLAASKLPSNVEMETHDFTREEIAEKRMLLLNDNGQVDYFLSGGSGPLNIQYLNMLSAHSSYWILSDFVRFLVIEIARRQERDAVLPVLRAEKKKGWKYHKGLG